MRSRGWVSAALAGVGIGSVVGVLILCAWEWHQGGSPDPRCVFGIDGYFPVLYRVDSGALKAECEYKPDIMGDGAR